MILQSKITRPSAFEGQMPASKPPTAIRAVAGVAAIISAFSMTGCAVDDGYYPPKEPLRPLSEHDAAGIRRAQEAERRDLQNEARELRNERYEQETRQRQWRELRKHGIFKF